VANRLLAPHGLGLAQWAVLVSIWRNGALSVKAIAEFTGNAPPAASRIVERMVQAGLLLRHPDPVDRRAVVVDLSDRGEALRPLHDLNLEVNRILLSDLSVDEAERLFDLLDRVQTSGRRWLGDTSGDLPPD
jgi:DNA-binding MarR family transcriptional regulator